MAGVESIDMVIEVISGPSSSRVDIRLRRLGTDRRLSALAIPGSLGKCRGWSAITASERAVEV